MDIELREMTDDDMDRMEHEELMWAIKCGFNSIVDYRKELYHASEGMQLFGGSFASRLGAALVHADYINAGKIAFNFRNEVREHAALHRKFIANRDKKTDEKE